MRDRRLEGRYLCADLVRVDWLHGENNFRTAEGVLEDICSPGACVQVEEAIPLGATIMLTIGGSDFTGTVCYCVFREYGYFVGIQFAEDNTWTRDRVTPSHLFNPQMLTSR